MASTEALGRLPEPTLEKSFVPPPRLSSIGDEKTGFQSPGSVDEKPHPLPQIPRLNSVSPLSSPPSPPPHRQQPPPPAYEPPTPPSDQPPPPPPHQPPPPPPHKSDVKSLDFASPASSPKHVSSGSAHSHASLLERLKRKSLPQTGVNLQDSGAQKGQSSNRASEGGGMERRFSFEQESRRASASPQSFNSRQNAEDGALRPEKRASRMGHASTSSGSSHGERRSSSQNFLGIPRSTIARPASAYTLNSDVSSRGRSSPRLTVEQGSPRSYARAVSASRRSPENRPASYIDLLNNVPYSQQVAPSPNIENNLLRAAVGNNASLLNPRKTLEMYRQNVKKTNDPAIQYEFAIFMIHLANDPAALGDDSPSSTNVESNPDSQKNSRSELLRESRQILQRLADRSYPFAQYYLGDGYASGLFSKGKEDYDHAFTLFVAAGKHGHAEAAYRAALCYEFGWGCRKDYAKAAQFHRQAASKNHPGAATRLGMACLRGEMGLVGRYREGIKWLKRAAESADFQYNTAPYELGLLHITGYGDDIFKDEAYAAQLVTQSADLAHPDANFMMGEVYEHGRYGCPKDAALSVHFYNGAAQAGLPHAMMALCAWYMVGAPPVLEKDENEAYEWAKKAAETGAPPNNNPSTIKFMLLIYLIIGLPKAEYAVGYFTEMGIGCRRDPLEANVWYVRAADNGDDRAKQRLAIIRAAASGDPERPMSVSAPKSKELAQQGKSKDLAPGKGKLRQKISEVNAKEHSPKEQVAPEGGKDKECVVM
ncbi:MAG: hypothetical protein M1820_002923 [Bogoriella megaspora]|nr:MAG: hypothetical protein M1820_002923 [Bogoriella megaspora]